MLLDYWDYVCKKYHIYIHITHITTLFLFSLYLFLDAHHRFTAEESDWGFTRFYDLRKLFTPCENRTRALIENDSTNITAFVRVLKDPTGVLWHNFIKYTTSLFLQSLFCKYSPLFWLQYFWCRISLYSYDSKKETGYVGLKIGTNYMNSLLQSLYCTTYFRKVSLFNDQIIYLKS
jgi:hypothetical protein